MAQTYEGAQDLTQEARPHKKGRAKAVAAAVAGGALLTLTAAEVYAPHSVERVAWGVADSVTTLVTHKNPEELRNERLAQALKRNGAHLTGGGQ
jgi:hypothetical protein